MSDFRKKFEEAVHSVAAEIEAMDDATFEKMLAKHRDGDIAQILRELDFQLEPVFIGMLHATFITAHARPITQTLEVAEFVRFVDAQNYAGTPDECLTAA